MQSATGVAVGAAEILGKVETVSGVDPGAASKIFDVNPVEGSLAGLGRTGIAVYKDVATADHLKLGSTVPEQPRRALVCGHGHRGRLPGGSS